MFCVSLAAWISQIKAEKVCFAPVTGLQTPLLENSYSFMKPNLSIQEPHKVGFISLNNVISLISLKVSTVQKRHTMIDHEELLLYGGSESFIEVDFLSPPPISTFPQGKCLQSVPGQQLTRSRSTADRLTLPYWIIIWLLMISGAPSAASDQPCVLLAGGDVRQSDVTRNYQLISRLFRC